MQTKEYIVILEDGIDYNTVWNDIENTTSGLPHIPDRAVSIVNNRDVQPRMCHYALTDDEAEKLQSDPRVLAVERPPEQIGLFPVPPAVFGPSNANVSFKIPSQYDASGNHINWSLIRNSYPNNTYANTTTTTSEYVYSLDGTNVDVVIMDTGIEYYHPEFKDKNGNVRIVLQNWTGALDTTPNSINFSDTNGHGTASASLVAGLNYGWARNATIYPCKIGTGGPGGLDFAVACDAITAWHKEKTNGRPTVVLGEITYLLAKESISVTSINYRNGGDVPANSADPAKGMATHTYTLPIVDFPTGIEANGSSQGQTTRVTSVDTAVENMITNGIIFVTAAGNQGVKISQPTDSSNKTNDYWNYWNGTYNGVSYPVAYRYYNRGPSPCTPNSIVTGAMMPGLNSYYKNYKASFSNAGYNVTVFTPGYNVRSATSNTNDRYTTAPYFLNGSFKQTNFTGTSAACPQIAGIVALYLQSKPDATQQQVKAWLISNADYTGMYTTGQSDDYTNYQSQWGGNAGVAYQNLKGLMHVKDNTGAWKQVKAVWVNDNGTWKRVKASYHNINGTWTPTYTG